MRIQIRKSNKNMSKLFHFHLGYVCPISLGWRLVPWRLQETQSGVVTEDIMLNSTKLRQNEGGQEPFLALVASS